MIETTVIGRTQYAGAVFDRHTERGRLDDLIKRVNQGRGSTLLLDGGAGVGKTTLLDYVKDRTTGTNVLSVTGIQSEAELPYAALYQLCRPLADFSKALPAPQREALETTFGQRSGPIPSKLLVGLATLGLLAEASQSSPILCVIDDAQWLDDASTRTLAFVARRLEAEAVGMVFAVRTPSDIDAFNGFPRVTIAGLLRRDAEGLLSTLAGGGTIDRRAMERILDEAEGNPLAIAESARSLSRAEISSGFVLSAATAPNQLEERYHARIAELPGSTRTLLLVAAAEPSAEPRVILAAAEALGVPPGAIQPAIDAGLCSPGSPIRFRHPLVRSAVYRAAPLEAIRAAHGALAAVAVPEADPDLLAWHRARATLGTDEEAAADLVAAAGRVHSRGGGAAAAALFRQAVEITADARRKAEWSLRSAQAELEAGQFDRANRDVALALAGQLDPLRRAEATLTAARIEFARERGGSAVSLLLIAAEELTPLSADSAREAYLEAFSAAMFGASMAEADVRDVAQRWVSSVIEPGEQPAPLLLEAMARVILHRNASTMYELQEAATRFKSAVPAESTHVNWLWHATIAALAVWDFTTWEAVSLRHLGHARGSSDYSELPVALTTRGYVHLFRGELSAANAAVNEMAAVANATGGRMNPSVALGTAAVEGRDDELSSLVRSSLANAEEHADGSGFAVACWAAALLDNSRGNYVSALAWGRRASVMDNPLHSSTKWALIETIEAASRVEGADASVELGLLETATQPVGSNWGTGVYARSKALLSSDADAEEHYREAIRLLSLTPNRLDLARAMLVYGEWLRRRRRLSDARTQLQRAYELFEAMGAAPFGERATRELLAAGARPRRESAATRNAVDLTAQEAQIAQMASEGLTNGEIATRMFISPRTVEYHLAKVFSKLQITSRHQLTSQEVRDLVGC